MGKTDQNEIHFLQGWQQSLSALPEGTGIYVIFGCGDRPKEPEKVFLDYAAATLWLARKGRASLNYVIKVFIIYRESGNELTLLKQGVTDGNLRARNCALKPSNQTGSWRQVKPYFIDEKANIRIYHADWREIDRELLRSDLLICDPPYGISEAKGKNKSRTKLAVAKDYGVADWDDEPVSDFDLIQLRDLTKYQIIFGGNYFVLPPSKCWLVWDKLNSGDFADAELAWTNLDKAVRVFRYLWNGMIKEQPEFRTHPTQKPVSVISWALTQAPKDVKSVVDPYAGVCTTALACKKMGLSCICVEREEKYAEDGAKRLEQEVFNFK